MPEIERRYLREAAEWRASEQGPGVLYGYAAKFNTPSQDLGGFIEDIAPGAFSKTVGEARVLCRYNHSDNHLLGTTIAGTLRLSIDQVGLAYEVDLPDTTVGRDTGVLAQRGDVRFSSFAFDCIRDLWEFPESGPAKRTLLEVRLVDVAPVNSPAYLDTSVAKRSMEEQKPGVPVAPPAEDVQPVEAGTDESDAPPEGHPSKPIKFLSFEIELDKNK